MANTISISNLAADIYVAMDTVAREQTGAINSVSINRSGAINAGKGDTIRSHITNQGTLETTYTPSMTVPDATDITVDNTTFVLDKVATYRIPITGELVKSLNNGAGYEVVKRDLFAQAFRSICNKIEVDITAEMKISASRAVGVNSAYAFASNTDLLIDARQVLEDNGAPLGQISAVISSLGAANLRKLTQLQKANEAGGTELLRRGQILDLHGISIKQSAGLRYHTVGTLSGSTTTTNAGFAAGVTSVGVAAAGTGTIVPGDVVYINGDTNGYVVNTGVASAASGGTIGLNRPGLVQAVPASAKALTLAGSYNPSFVFAKEAVELAVRAPFEVPGGDAATDRMTFSDPATGLNFLISEYKGYGMSQFVITCFYGVKVWKPEFLTTIIGK